jgi:hypothetical protein
MGQNDGAGLADALPRRRTRISLPLFLLLVGALLLPLLFAEAARPPDHSRKLSQATEIFLPFQRVAGRAGRGL